MRRKLVAGNWKMNGLTSSLEEIKTLISTHSDPQVDILICPPATLLHQAATATSNTALTIGAQDCHADAAGAHTGDLSAAMLKDVGAQAIIIGHSERRQDHGESDTLVRAKARATLAQGLRAVLCLGESLAEREAENTLDIVSGQMAACIPDEIPQGQLVIAYEPIWAIGTGRTPTLEQIAEVHSHIRTRLAHRFGEDLAQATPILYGGSVKAENAADIFAVDDVDGALVGGASLTADSFSPIVTALEAHDA